MKYSAALLVSTLAALAKAVVQLTNTNFDVEAGVPFTITWTGASGTVDIYLKNGESGDLKDVETITTGATGTSFVWTPDSDLPSDTYAFEIKDESGSVNYSEQFAFVGTGTATPTASTASSTTTGSATGSTTKTSSTSTESESTTSSASLTSTTMHVSNSTTLTTSASSTSAKISTTASSTGSSATSSSTGVPNTNNGQRVASSLALVLGAIAAFVAFN